MEDKSGTFVAIIGPEEPEPLIARMRRHDLDCVQQGHVFEGARTAGEREFWVLYTPCSEGSSTRPLAIGGESKDCGEPAERLERMQIRCAIVGLRLASNELPESFAGLWIPTKETRLYLDLGAETLTGWPPTEG